MIGGGPYIKMSKDMLAQLQHVGNDVSCGACALEYLGLPKPIIDELVRTAEGQTKKRNSGLGDEHIKNVINRYENYVRQNASDYMADDACGSQEPTKLFFIARERKKKKNKKIMKEEIIDNDWGKALQKLEPLESQDLDNALDFIFDEIPIGYATIVGMTWANEEGHLSVFAKGKNGNRYLIENQFHGGIYKNNEILDYLNHNQAIGFTTFECGLKINSHSKGWRDDRIGAFRREDAVDVPLSRQPSVVQSVFDPQPQANPPIPVASSRLDTSVPFRSSVFPSAFSIPSIPQSQESFQSKLFPSAFPISSRAAAPAFISRPDIPEPMDVSGGGRKNKNKRKKTKKKLVKRKKYKTKRR